MLDPSPLLAYFCLIQLGRSLPEISSVVTPTAQTKEIDISGRITFVLFRSRS